MSFLNFINQKKFKVLRIILGGVFSVVALTISFIQFYDWYTKSEYKLTYSAFKHPIVFPPEIASMEEQNSGYKILFNYLKATKDISLLNNQSPDSIVEKLFELGGEHNMKYQFIRDTGTKMPFISFMYAGIQEYYEIELRNEGEKEIEDIELHNLSASGFYRIYSMGYDIDDGVLATTNDRLPIPTFRIGNLKPNEKCRIGIWLIDDITKWKQFNKEHKLYLLYKNGKPKTLKFLTPTFETSKYYLIIFLVIGLNFVVLGLLFIYRNRKNKQKENPNFIPSESSHEFP